VSSYEDDPPLLDDRPAARLRALSRAINVASRWTENRVDRFLREVSADGEQVWGIAWRGGDDVVFDQVREVFESVVRAEGGRLPQEFNAFAARVKLEGGWFDRIAAEVDDVGLERLEFTLDDCGAGTRSDFDASVRKRYGTISDEGYIEGGGNAEMVKSDFWERQGWGVWLEQSWMEEVPGVGRIRITFQRIDPEA
jgi:hypothetical protein